MGDIEAEEAARKKAEEKRAQKKAAKKEEAPVEAAPEPEVKKPVKKKEAERYHFAAGKKYLEAKKLVDPKKVYSPSEAFELVKKTSTSSFDGTVEVHLNVTDKNLRGIVALPNGTGKQVRVRIADDALIANPVIDFDILVASPDMMPKLAKIAKILGPKGLMPNPKTGTIGPDPEKLAKELSGGQTQWKTQPDFPIIHATIGKVSWEPKKLADNFAALTKSIGKDKIVSVFVKATMGPAIRTQVH